MYKCPAFGVEKVGNPNYIVPLTSEKLPAVVVVKWIFSLSKTASLRINVTQGCITLRHNVYSAQQSIRTDCPRDHNAPDFSYFSKAFKHKSGI